MENLFSDDRAETPPYVVLDDAPIMPFSQTIDWGLQQMRITELHSLGLTGQGIKVAVLDTGVDTDHPDLKITDALDFTRSGTVEDTVGHGTHVAGIIAAQGNEQGTLGVAPGVNIYSYKVLADGSGNLVDVANAIKHAADNGIDVINMSLGSPSNAAYLEQACSYAASKGVIIVVSSGNSGKEQKFYPASYSACYSTGASNIHKAISGFSSFTDALEWAAPGERILSTYLKGGYAVLSGTSMAAPFATGCVALMKQAGVRMEYNILTQSTDDILTPGFDKKSGYGIINPHKAISDLKKPEQPSPSLKDELLKMKALLDHILELV